MEHQAVGREYNREPSAGFGIKITGNVMQAMTKVKQAMEITNRVQTESRMYDQMFL